MTPEISSAIAALTSNPEVFKAIAAIYEQGRQDGIQESGELAELLSRLPTDFNPEIILLEIEDLDLNNRARNLLRRNNVNTVWNLIQMSESGLRGLRNFKDSDLEDVKTRLAHYGLGLRAGA